MRNLIFIASVAAMAATTPLLAQSQGRGRGHGQGHGVQHPTGHQARTTRGHSADHAARMARACPPGLANRTPACVPPGQARKMWNVGQRVPASFRYAQIPVRYRDQVTLDPRYRYTYNDGLVYVVDRRTRLVQSIINLIR